MNIDDRVWILPAATNLEDKIEGVVIEVETNDFNGIVISAKTTTGEIYFGPESSFVPIHND